MARPALRPIAEWASEHPLAPLALRAAVAAMVAWAVVLPLGGIADEYPYYAPLGAVASVSTSVTRTLRASGEAFVALLLGATLGVVGQVLPLPEVAALGLVVAVGTALSAWPALGSMASWVPISALFVLVVGGSEPWPYAAAYLGLTTLGALVGVGVNAAFPPLALATTRRAYGALRTALVQQLEELAEVLEQEVLPTREEWRERQWELEPRARRVRELVADVSDAPQLNWRAHRWRGLEERQRRHGRALASLAFLVEDLTEFLADHERADLEAVALGPTLRPPAAHTLRATAAVLDSVDGSVADAPLLRRAHRAADGLGAAIRSARRRTDRDQFAAGTLLTGIRRLLRSVPAGPEPSLDQLRAETDSGSGSFSRFSSP